jgi:low molecular weight protein-tyrosine phosphatase
VPAHCAKQFEPADFPTRDVVVALDTGHYNVLWWLAAQTDDVTEARAKIVLLRAFDPKLRPGEDPDVPDPYYGQGDGFLEVLAQVERSCVNLLAAVQRGVESGAEHVQQAAKPPL